MYTHTFHTAMSELDVGWDGALNLCWSSHIGLWDVGVLGQHLSEVLTPDGLINDQPLHNFVNSLPVVPAPRSKQVNTVCLMPLNLPPLPPVSILSKTASNCTTAQMA